MHVYSKNEEMIGEENEIIKNLAKQMRKRIVVRSSPDIRLSYEAAQQKIQELVPAEAEITNIFFDDSIKKLMTCL